MKKYISDHLRGCLELSLFLRRGAERFRNSPRDFRFSFLVPGLLIPVNVMQAYAYPEFRDAPWSAMVAALSYQVLISTAFLLGVAWLVSWPLERQAQFFRFATAYNWLSLVGCFVLLPYMLVFLLLPFSAEQLSHLLITTIGLFFCIMAFTIRHTLNVSWMIAILLTFFAAGCEVLAALMLF